MSGGYPAALLRGGAAAAPPGTATTSKPRSSATCATSRASGRSTRFRVFSPLAAGYTAQLLNVSDLAGPFQLTRPTIHDYVTLLERVFLLERLPPWHSNRLEPARRRRPSCTSATPGWPAPCSAWMRTGSTRPPTLGPLLETFVLQELQTTGELARAEPLSFLHFRDRDDFEVDIVIEGARREVAGVEVKAAASVSPRT